MKRILYRLIPPSVLKFVKRIFISSRELTEREWKDKGCPSPPPHVVKQAVIDEYRRAYDVSTLIETGTYRGDMIFAQKDRFKKVMSIELGLDFFQAAKERFKSDQNVVLYHGDSATVMPQVLPQLTGPAIFWLDGHYMPGVTEKGNKECPVYEEVDAILKYEGMNHVMLIDDARLFVGKYDYPTIPELAEFVKKRSPRYDLEVKYDIIRITPGTRN
jgi:hypothetical protein